MIKPTSPPQQPMTFRHAGDAGDIIYALPAIKYFGRGLLYIESAPYTRVPMTPDKWNGLDLLLKAQPYIADVKPWNREATDWNCNDFRSVMVRQLRQGIGKDRHLSDWLALAFRIPLTIKDDPWLTVEPSRVARVVINRAGAGRPAHQQYYGKDFPWGKVLEKYGKDAVFIGTPLEHQVFCAAQGKVPYYPTATLLEAARVIAGADLCVLNQSSCGAIAEALKKPILLEVWHQGPNTLVHRDGVIHGWDHNVELPYLIDSLPVAGTNEPTPPLPIEITTETKDQPMAEPPSETSRYRHLVAHLCAGNGVDLGSADDKIVPHAIAVDLPQRDYARYNTTRPEAIIQWRGDARDLPFKEHTLDFVASAHLLEDFPLDQWQSILNEWSRVLKPGAHLIISLPSHLRFRAAVSRGQGDNLSHRHESEPGELTSLLAPMGYDVLRDSFVSDHPYEYSILVVARKK